MIKALLIFGAAALTMRAHTAVNKFVTVAAHTHSRRGITNFVIPAYVMLAAMLALSAAGAAHAETYLDTVQFVRYLDESTALGDVRKGNIDMYFWGIPSEWLADEKDREGLKIYESTSSLYSILANPAETEEFNPFALRDVRFALNYLLDRDLVVNELLNGLGASLVSSIGPYDAEFIDQIELLESYDFRYDPARAQKLIDGAMYGAGAVRDGDGTWTLDGEPVELRFFIRSDDPVRSKTGEVLAQDLETAGFAVHRDYGDLNKALAVVYGADPADLDWHLYTEGWAAPTLRGTIRRRWPACTAPGSPGCPASTIPGSGTTSTSA